MNQPAISLDEQSHVYTVDGQPTRSVTQVLEDAGISDWSGVPPDILKAAQNRGHAVHLCCHYINKRNLDPASVDERIAGYVEGWKKAKRDQGWIVRLSEHLVYRRITISDREIVIPSPSDLSIVGTLDVEGIMGRNGATVNDLKTGEPTDAWGPQTAAYVRALHPNARYTHKRVVTQLLKRGDYRLHCYPLRDFDRDWGFFRHAMIESKRKYGAA